MIHLLHVLHRFYEEGGTELAPMSTTEDIEVALHYSMSQVPLLFRFEARGRSRGVEIGFLSLYPKEKEFLYAPLTGLILLQVKSMRKSILRSCRWPRAVQVVVTVVQVVVQVMPIGGREVMLIEQVKCLLHVLQ